MLVESIVMTDMSFEQLCELFNYTPKGRPLDPKECSEVLSISVDTLEGYRGRGVPLRHFSPPGSRIIRYAERDVLAWLAAGARFSTSEQLDHPFKTSVWA